MHLSVEHDLLVSIHFVGKTEVHGYVVYFIVRTTDGEVLMVAMMMHHDPPCVRTCKNSKVQDKIMMNKYFALIHYASQTKTYGA